MGLSQRPNLGAAQRKAPAREAKSRRKIAPPPSPTPPRTPWLGAGDVGTGSRGAEPPPWGLVCAGVEADAPVRSTGEPKNVPNPDRNSSASEEACTRSIVINCESKT